MAVAAGSFDAAQDDSSLFRRERFVKARFATIGCVAMNDAALRRFVDGGNCRANLIGTAI